MDTSIAYAEEDEARSMRLLLDEYDDQVDAAIEKCLSYGLDLRGVANTELFGEVIEIAAGEAWCETEIAGLQFYDYGAPGLDDEPVIPRDGDRLTLIREPENPHDYNAIEVWWRNGVRLGHLPRSVAAAIADRLDAGEPCLAYVASGGTGEAWTARAILVGEGVRPLHEKRIARAVRDAIEEHESREREAERRRRHVGRDNGRAFEIEQAERRQGRMLQAAKALLATVPLEVEPPPVGEIIELYKIESLLGVSRSTARRIAERAGCRVEVEMRGWFATGSYVTVTDRLQEAIREYAARPLRIRAEDVKLSSGTRLAHHYDEIPF